MKKLLSLLCLAGILCVVGCTGGPKATGNTAKGSGADTSVAPTPSK